MYGNKYLVGATLLLVTLITVPNSFCQNACNPEQCNLPACRCSGSDIPGNLSRADAPQLVFLSFDAAVNEDNFAFYKEVLFNRKNPNNQPITATFFVAHDYTIYYHLHELWRNGHEVGLHSISGNSAQAYWQNLTTAGWRAELIDQREQITSFANIPASEIKGVRAPQLLVGGDTMYSVLKQARLKYDSSRPTQAYRQSGLWPYTNDYNSTQDCLTGTCPVQPHEGFWTVPIINYVSDSGSQCSLADQCEPVPETANATFDLLYRNFETHYNGHRSPFGIFTRHGWVNGTGDDGDDRIWERRLGYVRFLDYLSTLNDVYIVSISRALEWVQSPTPLATVANFPAFQVTQRASQCTRKYDCQYLAGQTPFKPPLSQERMFRSCIPCPTAYPWVGNHLGRDRYE